MKNLRGVLLQVGAQKRHVIGHAQVADQLASDSGGFFGVGKPVEMPGDDQSGIGALFPDDSEGSDCGLKPLVLILSSGQKQDQTIGLGVRRGGFEDLGVYRVV